MQFALLVSAIVALLLSAFIALTHTHSFFAIQSDRLIAMVNTTNLAVLETIANVPMQTDTLITTTKNNITKTHVAYHGAWYKAFVSNQSQGKKVAKTALFGSSQEAHTPNLYLNNWNAPLIVVGRARIEGNSYLPKAGVRAGTIAGNYYQGSALTYGSVRESKDALPVLEDSWREYLRFMTSKELLQNKEVVAYTAHQKQSFLAAKKVFYSPAAITINSSIQGNCIVVSTTKIIVTAAAVLNDVILVAPEIDFQTGFGGVVQALATKQIRVAKNVQLNYPSSLVVLKEVKKQEDTSSRDDEDGTLIIATGTEVQGSVVVLKKKTKDVYYDGVKSDVVIAAGAQVIGAVYCEGNTELLGTVKGALYTQQFVANQYGSIYMNHIYNGRVLQNPIPDYSGLPFANRSKILAKWMY